jgi:hypothetical protein
MLVGEKVFDIFQITGYQVVHAYYMITFFDKSIAQMRPEESGSTGN